MPDLTHYKKYSPLGSLAADGLICAFSCRSHENMSLFYGDTTQSLNNRDSFLLSLGLDYRDLVCAKQIHSGGVKYVKEDDRGRGALNYDACVPDTDAFITDKKNLPLAIFTADCLSIFLFDPKTPAIGLVHAGWQSTRERIVANTLQLMKKEFGCHTEDIYIGFGPAIRSCCYEVGGEFKDIFSDEIIQKNNKYYLDLAKANKKQFLDSGARHDNIFDPQICTFCGKEEFFSFRRQGKGCGRSMSVIMLK